MRELKLPDTFNIPEEFVTPDFYFRPLRFSDIDEDYAAVMSSIDIINKTRGYGGGWPDPAMTREENHRDLGWHDKEFEDRSSFAYIAFSADKTEYLGCFYFYPPGTRGTESGAGDVDVSFWVTQKAYDAGCYATLYSAIGDFLKLWPFDAVVFTNEFMPE